MEKLDPHSTYIPAKEQESIDDTLNRLVDINNHSYSNLNFEPEKIHYFISTELSGKKLFLEYRFDKDSAQLLGYDRYAAEFAVKTSLFLNLQKQEKEKN